MPVAGGCQEDVGRAFPKRPVIRDKPFREGRRKRASQTPPCIPHSEKTEFKVPSGRLRALEVATTTIYSLEAGQIIFDVAVCPEGEQPYKKQKIQTGKNRAS